jgi:alpha-glucosidase
VGSLRGLVESVVSIGVGNVLSVLGYTAARKRLERRYPPPASFPWLWPLPRSGAALEGETGVIWRSVDAVTEVARTSRGVQARFMFNPPADGPETLEIAFLKPDLVRVTWRSPLDGLPLPPRNWPEVKFDCDPAQEEGGWVLRTESLELRLSRDGRIGYYVPGGRLLREERPLLVAGDNTCHRAVLAAGEMLHGLGERAAPLDLRGGVYRMWNRDPGGAYGPGADPVYLSIPVYISRGGERDVGEDPAAAGCDQAGQPGPGYLIFYANSHPASLDLGRADPNLAEHRFAGGGLRYYFTPGPAPRALERYSDLTGRPDLPPLWALGYHQCRWSYYPEARVRKLAGDFLRHGIPLSAIHLDIHYMDGYRVFTVDKARFPDLLGLARELVAQDIRLVAICDPGVKKDPGYFLYQEGLAEGAFSTLPDGEAVIAPVWPGPCVFPDFSRPAVREWWGRQYRRLLETGVAGFWHDMNEPAAFVASGEPTLPLATRHALGDHRAVHNLYGLFMNEAAYEGLRRLDPERRPFIISRSGWAGLQRYAWVWTADVRSDWTCLEQTLATIIGLGLSGIPFSGSDVGGFNGKPTPELYVRWLQAGAFMAFFRSHTMIGTPDQEPFSYGEPYTTIAREFIQLRYALLPYIYTLAWEATQRGWPVVRPIWWDEDRRGAAGSPDPVGSPGEAFLLGDALLVAPVTEAGATSREVPVPAGLWYDFWTDRPVEGPSRLRMDAPLGRIPVLVRAGTVLPMTGPMPAVDGRKMAQTDLRLHVYPPLSGVSVTSLLYTDEGDGYGPHRVDRFVVTGRPGEVEFHWTEERSDFPWPYRRAEVLLGGAGKPDGGRPTGPLSTVVLRLGDR